MVSVISSAVATVGIVVIAFMMGAPPADPPATLVYVGDGLLWWWLGSIAMVLVGVLLFGVSKVNHWPRFLIHECLPKHRWMWRTVGVWHAHKYGGPVPKDVSSWRTVSAVYCRLWTGNLLVFQWRGFYRSRQP